MERSAGRFERCDADRPGRVRMDIRVNAYLAKPVRTPFGRKLSANNASLFASLLHT